jgi:hypothetical protein
MGGRNKRERGRDIDGGGEKLNRERERERVIEVTCRRLARKIGMENNVNIPAMNQAEKVGLALTAYNPYIMRGNIVINTRRYIDITLMVNHVLHFLQHFHRMQE